MKRAFGLPPSAFAVGLGLVVLAAGAGAATPYAAIARRNVFGLKPAALNANVPPPPAAAVTVKLLGISTILDRRQVMLKVKTAARPPEPAKEQSYLLSQGQREDEIEVLEINAAAGTVKLKNQEEILSLSMKDDAEKPAVGAGLPVAALPGVAVPPPPSPQPPGLVPVASPTRQPAVPGSGPRTIPTRSLRALPTDGAGPSAASQRSIEENVLLYEANRIRREQSGGNFPRMPPHSLLKQPSQ